MASDVYVRVKSPRDPSLCLLKSLWDKHRLNRRAIIGIYCEREKIHRNVISQKSRKHLLQFGGRGIVGMGDNDLGRT